MTQIKQCKGTDMTKKEKSIKKIAMLVALASVVQIAENLLPSPLPGVKLGLANIITLVVLSDMGFKAAFEVAVLSVLSFPRHLF